jgi:hypothetical protein
LFDPVSKYKREKYERAKSLQPISKGVECIFVTLTSKAVEINELKTKEVRKNKE